MTEKYEYCSIVPRTFVQDCSTYTAEGKLLSVAFLQARKLL